MQLVRQIIIIFCVILVYLAYSSLSYLICKYFPVQTANTQPENLQYELCFVLSQIKTTSHTAVAFNFHNKQTSKPVFFYMFINYYCRCVLNIKQIYFKYYNVVSLLIQHIFVNCEQINKIFPNTFCLLIYLFHQFQSYNLFTVNTFCLM